MTGVRASALAVLAVVLLALGASAHADPREDAKNEFAAGQAADRQKDWKLAIEHYLRAYDLVPHPFALFNIAADYEQLGKPREAAHYYQLYVDAPEATDREKVRKQIRDLRDKPAKLEVTSTPDGATITIDGQSVGTTPYTGRLKGGRHEIVVERDDQRASKVVVVEFGEPVVVDLAVGRRQGSLAISGSPPGARVAIDGVDVGTMPLAVPIEAGEHKVEVTQVGYQRYEQTATVAPNRVTSLRPQLVRELGGAGDSTIKGFYEVGGGGGVDARGNGYAYDVEVGLRASQYEFLLTAGKVNALTSVELLLRYSLLKSRLTPFVGAGYSYLGAGIGFEVQGGLRADLVETDAFAVSLIGSVAARYSAKSDTSSTTTADSPVGYFPIGVSLQLSYRVIRTQAR